MATGFKRGDGVIFARDDSHPSIKGKRYEIVVGKVTSITKAGRIKEFDPLRHGISILQSRASTHPTHAHQPETSIAAPKSDWCICLPPLFIWQVGVLSELRLVSPTAAVGHSPALAAGHCGAVREGDGGMAAIPADHQIVAVTCAGQESTLGQGGALNAGVEPARVGVTTDSNIGDPRRKTATVGPGRSIAPRNVGGADHLGQHDSDGGHSFCSEGHTRLSDPQTLIDRGPCYSGSPKGFVTILR